MLFFFLSFTGIFIFGSAHYPPAKAAGTALVWEGVFIAVLLVFLGFVFGGSAVQPPSKATAEPTLLARVRSCELSMKTRKAPALAACARGAISVIDEAGHTSARQMRFVAGIGDGRSGAGNGRGRTVHPGRNHE